MWVHVSAKRYGHGYRLGLPIGRSPMIAPGGNLPLGSWPLFDPRREQADDLSYAGRAQIWPADGRVDPA